LQKRRPERSDQTPSVADNDLFADDHLRAARSSIVWNDWNPWNGRGWGGVGQGERLEQASVLWWNGWNQYILAPRY